MTLCEVKANSVATGLGLGSRSINETLKAFTPTPSLLLDSTFRIIQVSASYLALNHLTLDECLGLNIYDLVKAKALIPSGTSLHVVLDNAIATRNIYGTGEF
jgi:osomolarity two-component system sensor histidine kinase TcsA